MYRLALALGRPNPDRMLAEMSPVHLHEWREFFRRTPFGDTREDLRFALLAVAMERIQNGIDFDPGMFFPFPQVDDDDETCNEYSDAELIARYKR